MNLNELAQDLSVTTGLSGHPCQKEGMTCIRLTETVGRNHQLSGYGYRRIVYRFHLLHSI